MPLSKLDVRCGLQSNGDELLSLSPLVSQKDSYKRHALRPKLPSPCLQLLGQEAINELLLELLSRAPDLF